MTIRVTANARIDLTKPLAKFAWVNRLFKQEWKNTGWNLDPKIKVYVRKIFNQVRRDLDCYITITGHTGYGKSNLACMLGYLIDPNFSLENNVIYTPTIEEMRLKVRYRKAVERSEEIPKGALKPYSVLVIDEAIKVLYKLEQWSGVARYIKKLFELARTENKIIILCIPDFLDMGNTFRNRMDYWIDIFHREKEFAYACVEAPSKNKYRGDKWNLKDNEKTYEQGVGRKKYSDLRPIDNLNIYKRSRNYMAGFPFKKLPPTIESTYTSLKNQHDYDAVEPAKKETGWQKKIKALNLTIGNILSMEKRDRELSYLEMANRYPLSRVRMNSLIKAYEVSQPK